MLSTPAPAPSDGARPNGSSTTPSATAISSATGAASTVSPAGAAASVSTLGTISSSSSSSTSSHAKRQPRGPRKQRILWDSDNATPDGKTSIGVLLEWLTAPGNYARWCDGKGQAGETREKLCSEINAALRSHGILHRENANIRTQISELERAFDAAVLWLVEQGFGGRLPPAGDDAAAAAACSATPSSSPGGTSSDSKTPRSVAEAHVQRLCRYFHVLYPVMSQMTSQPRTRRPYSRLSLGERRPSAAAAVDGGDDSGNETTSEHGSATNGSAATTATATPMVVLSRKRRAPMTSTTTAATTTATATASNAATPSFAQFEQAQRLFLEAAREERESKRLQLDEERNRLECEKLRYEVEAKRLELVVQRALARKRLLDAGLSTNEVDAILKQQQQEEEEQAKKKKEEEETRAQSPEANDDDAEENVEATATSTETLQADEQNGGRGTEAMRETELNEIL
ncbi:hypothetical protein PINS_up013153 [Pythium insidiosum]|nr:hypothetical protein PINS_up013153 [Pythium insidiosum]